MKRFKKCWIEIDGETYEDDDPFEVAEMILELIDDNEKLREKVKKAIIENMVEMIDDEDYLADCYNFHESLGHLNNLNIR